MNKQELIARAAEAAGISKKDGAAAFDAIFANIAKELKKGNKVALAGVGIFTVRKRAARAGRNPKTGAPLKIAASKAPAFRPAKGFKDQI